MTVMPTPADSAAWDEELAKLTEIPSLLQSWAWGEVQRGAGWRVDRVRLPGGGMASLQLRRTAGRWWAYVPRGPVPAEPGVVRELVDLARIRGLARLRVEPEAPPDLGRELRALGFSPRPDAKPQQPIHSSIVDLRPPAEEILASFKPKTRYNIRLAERRGVVVEATADAGELTRQAHSTEARQGIRLPSSDYYERLLRVLPWSRVYVARHEGDALAAILVARFRSRAYYLFGGSNGVKRELMPMYAAQWRAMSEAAADGVAEYDLWGVPPPGDPEHPWHGLMQFKSGFNGGLAEYCGTWDVDLNRTAALMDLAESGRRLAARFLNIR